MIKLEFSPEAIEALEYERYHHPPPKVQRKMEAVYLKSQRLSHPEIGRLCQIKSRTTLITYLQQYQAGGIDQLKELAYQGQPSELNEHATSLKETFTQEPPHSSVEAQTKIKRVTGLQRSLT